MTDQVASISLPIVGCMRCMGMLEVESDTGLVKHLGDMGGCCGGTSTALHRLDSSRAADNLMDRTNH